MPGPAIQPSIDAYGRYARASSLADHLELLALLGQTLTRKALADLINDRSWLVRLDELFVDIPVEKNGEFEEASDEDGGATDDEPGVPQANRVFDILDERVDLLGEFYPFIVEDKVTLRDDVDPRESPYVVLLAITLAHAHDVQLEDDPKQVLEDAVTAALAARGLLAVNVGAISRQVKSEGLDFRETVARCGAAAALQPNPDGAITLKHANEEGLDALGHLPWGDHRSGAWVFIGQATCGRSDGWSGKIGQAKDHTWKLLLNVGVLPLAFLAVPHHVEPHHFGKLVQDSQKLVLDRIRLARYRAEVTQTEVKIVDAVLETGAETLA